MLMKLASLSRVKGTVIERGNWLLATKKRSMPITQHRVGREQRGLRVKRTQKPEQKQGLKVKKLFSLGARGLLKVTREECR